MSQGEASAPVERYLESGDEAGSAPDDRPYRPDVEGLRAVAVSLVILLHFEVPGFTGGFVGVDVFFVISGFVICGLLLRERVATEKNSLLDFYARRFRRILPASTLVLVVAVATTYVFVSTRAGVSTAKDGRWVAAFLANFYFAKPGSNSLSALANYWSLSVEEQFYLVFPTLFVLVSKSKRGPPFRVRLSVGLGAVIVGSYMLSVISTSDNARWAYVSPFTRAWELALGALIASTTPWLKRIPPSIAAVTTWLGGGAVLLSALVFSGISDYPGWRVAVPVLGTAMVIAGGVVVPRLGIEVVLSLTAFRWIGQRSYSLYLWHWPVLIVAAEMGFTGMFWKVRLPCLVLTIVLAMLTYRFVENPIRHWRLPSRQSVWFGLLLAITTIVGLSAAIALSR